MGKQEQKYKDLLARNQELEERIKKLETTIEDITRKTEKLKARFLSNISHEIRTPMNAIMGFSNLLVDQSLSREKKEEYMEQLTRSSDKLLNLVESMLDMSLVETGQLKIRKEECYLNHFLKDLYHFYNADRHRKDQGNIALLLNTAIPQEDFRIITDPFRLHQVMSNLLSNAFKFTDKGVVEFGYTIEDQDELRFFVKDSGTGILLEKSILIFDTFEKGIDDPESQEILKSGVGLGLSLSKGLIKLMGGDIWVESNLFKGSTFYFTIPLQPVEDLRAKPFTAFKSNLFIA